MAAASVALICLGASAASAAEFIGDYGVSANTTDPGLKISTKPVATSLDFTLNAVGDHTSVDLFKIYTTESSVNLKDDFAPKPISISFDFTAPDVFGGSISGGTAGILTGFIESGVVVWSNFGNTVLDFGNGGELAVHVNDGVFDSGFLSLNGGLKKSATIAADFKLLEASAPISAAVPEPASWAIMLTGLFGLGAVLRRARKGVAAVAA